MSWSRTSKILKTSLLIIKLKNKKVRKRALKGTSYDKREKLIKINKCKKRRKKSKKEKKFHGLMKNLRN